MYPKLVPLIEFGPDVFRKNTRDSAPIDHPNYKEASKVFWYDMLADWEITDIHPYKNSWFVRITDISQNTLKKLVEADIETYDFSDVSQIEADEISAFEGGLALELETLHLLPQCCGDLGAIDEWNLISKSSDLKDYQMWVGHPMFEVSSIDSEQVQISTTFEYPTDNDKSVVACVKRQSLQTAVQTAMSDILEFEKSLEACLSSTGYQNSELLAKQLCGMSTYSVKDITSRD